MAILTWEYGTVATFFLLQVFPHPDIDLTDATRPHKLVSHAWL